MAPNQRHIRNWVLAAVIAAWVAPLLLGSVPSRAAEYVGLWRVDEAAPGIALGFPDNGFAGACVSLSNGGPEAGELRVEGQINRFRFDAMSLMASGQLDPNAVHVQLSVKGKTVWTGNDYQFDAMPINISLGGRDLVIEARELLPDDPEGEPLEWHLTFCDMTLANDRYRLRFTSDCAGFDFVEGDRELRIVADEDWLALEREITGGMALSSLVSFWGESDTTLTVETAFPDQLFYSALAIDDEPVLLPETGTAAGYDYLASDLRDYALVVKAKGPIVGQPQWRTLVRWELPEMAPEPIADVVGSDIDDDLMAVESPESSDRAQGTSSGCSRASGTTGGAHLFLLALLAIVGYHCRPRSRPARPGEGRAQES